MLKTQTLTKTPKTGIAMRSQVHNAANRGARGYGRPDRAPRAESGEAAETEAAEPAAPRIGSGHLRRPLVALPARTC